MVFQAAASLMLIGHVTEGEETKKEVERDKEGECSTERYLHRNRK